MVFIGVGGAIDGQVNPVLSAAEGQGVQITLINGEGAEHDIVFADQEATARSAHITGKGASTNIAFRAGKAGDCAYFCSLPGHQLAGMQGQFLITPQAPPQTLVEADISKLSTDLPPPIAKRAPQTIRVDLTTVELKKAASPKARRLATGLSTARCRVHSCACVSATPSMSASRIPATARWFTRSIFMRLPDS